ncbi:DUF4365 domain-containing protein [Microbacterium hominis]|uniref:DUF4365 domain-containing protein n=1 Tax=Microbacterium hominis TaxID=162426 RepID=UPI00068E8BC2|nr:DUF4365 domain-containing protein [Microbacterium hominis]
MTSQIATELTNRRAVALTESVVLDALGWIFRGQDTSDFGIDAHVEIALDDRATGELIALQIKGGPSAYKTAAEGGWYFPVAAKHADYWLNHSLPVVLVLADLEARRCYWEVIDSSTLTSTGKNFKVLVPQCNDLSLAADEWQRLTRSYLENADVLYDVNCQRLPPAVVDRLDVLRKTDPRAASSLAADLSTGRAKSELALDELLRVRRSWLDRHGRPAWTAVALYAREHGQFRQAAAAFERLADLHPERRASHLGDAAVMLANVDDAAGLVLAEAAYAHDPSDSASLVAMAYLRPDGSHYAKALTGRTDLRAKGYFGSIATRRGDDSEAIRIFTSILDDANEQSGVRLELSQLHCRRHLSAQSQPGDLAAAREFALEALTSRRQWTEDTDRALAAYARALALESRYEEALQTVTRPPTGTASKAETESTEVALIALDVARRLERLDLLPGIVASISDPADQQLAAEEARLARGATRDELVAHERNVLARTLEVGDAQRALQAALSLALHGVDESARIRELQPLKAYAALVTAIAATRVNPAANLADLRAMAKTEITAAEVVIQALIDLDRYSDAADACDLYLGIYGNASFILSKVKALYLAEKDDEALALLEDALGKNLLAGQPLYEAHRLLGRHYGDAHNWDAAIHHLRELIAQSPVFARDGFWNLLQCLMARGDSKEARALLDGRGVDPETEGEIAVWLRVVAATGWTQSTASLAVTLSLTDGVNPELATSLVGTIILDTRGTEPPDVGDEEGEWPRPSDVRPVVNGDIHRQAFEVMQSLLDKHGDHLAIRRFESDPGTLIDELKRLFPPERVRPLRALARQVAAGAIPIGFVCEVRHDPYGLILADRYLQPRNASSPDAADHATETDAAVAALNGRVVIDLSAVELSVHLDAWSECEGQFNVIVLATAQRADAQRSVAAARSATGSGGTLGVDSNGNPYMTEFEPEAQIATLRRCESVEFATRSLLTVDVGDKLTFASDLDGLGLSAWISSIEAAGRQGVPLWSDDVAQRRLARDLGIPTFGTVNLLEGLRLARLEGGATPEVVSEVSETQHAFIRHLLELRVVDQPVTVDDIIDNIARHPGSLAPSAVVLSRGAWWQSETSAKDWLRILEAVRRHSPHYRRTWQARAMTGILNAAPAEAAPRLVASLAAFGTAASPDVSDVVEGFRVGDQVCAEHDLTAASAHVAWAVSVAATMMKGIDPEQVIEDVLAAFQPPTEGQRPEPRVEEGDTTTT